MKTQHLTPKFVETFPTPLQPSVIYISIEFTTCGHLCACGCGDQVITPLSPAQWSFTYNGQDVSLRPSVGNWSLPCQSHYVIDRGHVRWAAHYSKDQIAANRVRDRRALDGHDLLGGLDGLGGPTGEPTASHDQSDRKSGADGRVTLWGWLRRWLRSDA